MAENYQFFFGDALQSPGDEHEASIPLDCALHTSEGQDERELFWKLAQGPRPNEDAGAPVKSSPPPRKALALSAGGTDWCLRFREALMLPSRSDDELLVKFEAMSSLARDFTCQAENYARIIISEHHLPLNEKTIRPNEAVGGYAGGQKYVCQNILFKFAVDDRGLFGGNDEPASKFAGHELRGLNWYLRYAQDLGILVPLTCVVDFMGMRILAKAVAPVGHDTLVYGSDNGGVTVHNANAELSEKMAKVALRLNLAAHLCQDIELHAACDVEGHLGTDGCFWLLDTARCWPPEAPLEDGQVIESSALDKRPLDKLLRPELVMANPVPLSPDALSGFGRQDRERLDSDVEEATRMLRTKAIPEFSTWLDSLSLREMRGVVIKMELHRRGINLRHLGLCFRRCTNSIARAELLMEMLARTFKTIVKRAFRAIREHNFSAVMEPYRRTLVDYLNLWFGEGTKTREHWVETVVPTLDEKFYGLLEDDKNYLIKCGALSRVDYMQVDVVFYRFRQHIHFDLSPAAERDLIEQQEITAKMTFDPFNFLVQLDRQNSGVDVHTYYADSVKPERMSSSHASMTSGRAPSDEAEDTFSASSPQAGRERARVYYYPDDGTAPMVLEVGAVSQDEKPQRESSAAGLERFYCNPRFARAQPFQDHDVVTLRPKIKCVNVVPLGDGLVYYNQALQAKSASDPKSFRYLIDMALQKFRETAADVAAPIEAHKLWGDAMRAKAVSLRGEEALYLFKEASLQYQAWLRRLEAEETSSPSYEPNLSNDQEQVSESVLSGGNSNESLKRLAQRLIKRCSVSLCSRPGCGMCFSEDDNQHFSACWYHSDVPMNQNAMDPRKNVFLTERGHRSSSSLCVPNERENEAKLGIWRCCGKEKGIDGFKSPGCRRGRHLSPLQPRAQIGGRRSQSDELKPIPNWSNEFSSTSEAQRTLGRQNRGPREPISQVELRQFVLRCLQRREDELNSDDKRGGSAYEALTRVLLDGQKPILADHQVLVQLDDYTLNGNGTMPAERLAMIRAGLVGAVLSALRRLLHCLKATFHGDGTIDLSELVQNGSRSSFGPSFGKPGSKEADGLSRKDGVAAIRSGCWVLCRLSKVIAVKGIFALRAMFQPALDLLYEIQVHECFGDDFEVQQSLCLLWLRLVAEDRENIERASTRKLDRIAEPDDDCTGAGSVEECQDVLVLEMPPEVWTECLMVGKRFPKLEPLVRRIGKVIGEESSSRE